MSSLILLNDTKIVSNNQTTWVRGGDTISDATVQAQLLAAGGILWPASDAVMAAAAAVALKLRSQGQDENTVTRALLAGASQSLTLGGVVIAEIPKTAADGSAAATTSETPQGLIGPNSSGPLGSAWFLPAAALTSNDTNFATLQVQKRTAGGAPVTVAQVTTQTAPTGGSGNWTAWQAIQIPNVGSPTFAALDAITYNIAKSGTGVVVPAGFLFLFSAS